MIASDTFSPNFCGFFTVLVFFSPSVYAYMYPKNLIFMDRYIEEEDLLRFMIKEEVDLVFPLIEGWDKGQIDRKALTDWVVRSLMYLVKFNPCLLILVVILAP